MALFSSKKELSAPSSIRDVLFFWAFLVSLSHGSLLNVALPEDPYYPNSCVYLPGGILVKAGESQQLLNQCGRLECLKRGNQYYLNVATCDDVPQHTFEEIPNGKCLVRKIPSVGDYPDCCGLKLVDCGIVKST